MKLRLATLAVGLVVWPFAVAEQTELETIHVKGDPLNRSVDGITQPMQVLSGDELEKNQSASIGETLAQSAGIHNSNFGSAVGRPVIRGLGGARVKVMQNGIDSLDVGTISPDHAVAVDSQHATQVEVMRGPAALIFGNGAAGGAVNVVDERIPFFTDHNHIKLGSQLSTVDEGRLHSFHGQKKLDGFNMQFSASSRSTQAYDVTSDDHPLDNSDLKQQAFNYGMAKQYESGQAGFAVSYMNQKFGLPGHAHEEVGAEEDEEARVHLEQIRLDAQLNQSFQLSIFNGMKWQFGWVDYQHEEGHESHEEEATPDPEEHHHDGLSHFKRKGFETRVGVNYQTSTDAKGVIGIQASNTQFSALGAEAIVPNTTSQQLGLFALHNIQLSEFLSTDLAARIERNTHDANQNQLETDHLAECGLTVAQVKDRDFDNASLSAGVKWQINAAISVRSQLSHVSRSAAAQELYSCGPHEATQTFEIGSSELDNEVSQVVDVGVQVNYPLTQVVEVLVDATVYRTNIADFIYQQNLSTQIDGFDAYAYQQQDAYLQGYEASIGFVIHHDWQVNVFTDSVVAKFDGGMNDGDYVPRMPTDRIGLELSYEQYLWNAYVRSTHYKEQDRLAVNETATQGFDLVSVGGSYLWLVSGHELKFYTQVQNALDEDVRYHTSIVKDDVPQPGRNVKLGVSYQF